MAERDLSFEASITPAQLAERAAKWSVITPGRHERAVRTVDRLMSLDVAAQALGISDKGYWVEAERAIALPREMEQDILDEEVPVSDYIDLSFLGNFIGYSKVFAGTMLHNSAYREIYALCLLFDQAWVLPSMPDDQMLHVPVLTVREMEKSERHI